MPDNKISPEEQKAYDAYLKSGGTMAYSLWVQRGKPTTQATVAGAESVADRQAALDEINRYRKVLGESTLSLGNKTIQDLKDILTGQQINITGTAPSYWTTPAEIATKTAEEVLTAKEATLGIVPPTTGEIKPAVRWETVSEGGWDFQVGYDANGKVVSKDPLGQTSKTGQPTIYPQFGEDPYGGQGQWNPYTGQWEPPAGYISPQQQWERDEAARQATATQSWQQQQMGWMQQQSQMQQQEQERQYKSQLAANPMSWLQYASYTGEQPVVQPWMLPLSQKEYGWQVGQPIQGYSQQGGGGMADLRTPSAQLWGRMGPTAQQQYQGYQQWDIGQSPEETQYRLKAQGAPSGQYNALRWMR